MKWKMVVRDKTEGEDQERRVSSEWFRDKTTVRGSRVSLYVDMVMILGWGECRGGVALTRRAAGEKKRARRKDDLLYVELHRVEERPHESEADTVQAAALG
jgi:hypothetical protein